MTMPTLRVTVFLAVKAIVKGNLGVTILTIFILILVATNLLFVPGLIYGLIGSANEQLIRNYSSNIIIAAKGRDTKIIHAKEFVNQIESLHGVVAATARNSIYASVMHRTQVGDERRLNVAITAIKPDREKVVFEVSDWMIEGTYLDSRDRNQILLGVQVGGVDDESVELYARSLRHVHAGDKVTLTYTNGVVREYRVKGIFKTAFIQTDILAFISDLEFDSVMPSMVNMATNIHVRLADDANPSEVIERIKSFRSDLDFQTWEQTAGIVNSMTTSFFIINQILNMVNALVAGITIFIVTYVDVVNRRRQIGILRAIGIKTVPIIFSYLLRALLYVAVGLIMAWLLFLYVVIPVEAAHPFHFPFGPVYLTVDMELLIRTAILLSIVSLVAAFIPVWLIMRVKIMDAIWG